MGKKLKIIIVASFLLLAGIRFIGLDYSPPGFYLDEAAGATQVICLQQQGGIDFYGEQLPLFFKEFKDSGTFTPAFIYGQLGWTSLFGSSTYSFRSFIAFVSILTIFCLHLYVRKIGNERLACLTTFSALIMPWSFHFSRISWDPPIAVFFLVLSLLLSIRKNIWWLTGISLAIAAYSYSPMRLTAPLILLMIPYLQWQKKIVISIVTLIACLPLFIAMQDQQFMARANNVVIWSKLFSNPYANSNLIKLFEIFLEQFLSHFSLEFLFFTGDQNLRHGIQRLGMVSWLGLSIPIAIGTFIFKSLIKKTFSCNSLPYANLFIVASIGIIISAIPAALTRDGIPHSLRALSSWPFYAIMSGMCLNYLATQYGQIKILALSILTGLAFFLIYQYHYFTTYPALSKGSFQSNGQYTSEAIALAYERMTKNAEYCSDIRKESRYAPPSETKINKPIDFSSRGSGTIYLRNSWQKQEAWGVWSNGYQSDLYLPLPDAIPSSLEMKLRAFYKDSEEAQIMHVLIDNNYVDTYSLDRNKLNTVIIPLKFDTLNKDGITVTLKFKSPGRPKTPFNDDDRLIAVGIETAIFRQKLSN